MSFLTDDLERRALAAGVILDRPGEHPDPIPLTTLAAISDALGPLGRQPPHGDRQAYVPEWLNHTRCFGVALQLYQLRSARNLGIGDLGDLRTLLPGFAAAGADFVGLNPLHALFTAAPERASPFSPSDRRFLNPLIVAVDEVPGYDPAMRARVTVPDAAEIVDYTAAAAAKLAVLRDIHDVWRHAGVSDADVHSAGLFVAAGGDALVAFATFEALTHKMVADGLWAGWWNWPSEYTDRSSSAVAAFAKEAAAEVEFHCWLQFVATEQLRATQEQALAAGMRIGLYLDLAVGAAPDGAQTWADPGLVMRGLRVGCPPDLFSQDGQDWGLAPFNPSELIAQDFGPYRAIMDAVMANAGAVRLDHAMGLERLWYIPDGAVAREGAYVRQAGLIDALVEATHEHRAIAVGEDLGIVPPGFRERMAARRIFSMRILAFERVDGVMRDLAHYPHDSLACLSTHDIAPLEAWWQADEIMTRRRLGKIDDADVARELGARRAEKSAILQLAGLPDHLADGPIDDAIVIAFHRVAASTASRMLAIRLEDVVGGRRLVNLPGTDKEHPNWRQTLPITVDEIVRSERLAMTLAAVRAIRGTSR